MISDKQKTRLIIILVIILAFSIIFLGYSISKFNKNSNFIKSDNLDVNYLDGLMNQSYPEGPTNEAKINSSRFKLNLIGQNELGTVEVFGPFGNPNSNVKIAYLIGMHPFESKVHNALFDTILFKNSSLKYSYYIYKINVTNFTYDSEGRIEGQLLAQKFLAPNVINGNYNLVVDVHSNKGTVSGTYEETNFIFAPGSDEKSMSFVNKLVPKLPGIVYYFPKEQSSPPYITLPIERSGTPTINYETFSYEPINKTYSLINNFVNEVDNLDFYN